MVVLDRAFVGCNSQRKLVAESRVHTAEHVATFSVQHSVSTAPVVVGTSTAPDLQAKTCIVHSMYRMGVTHRGTPTRE